jgi:hypothetical protein
MTFITHGFRVSVVSDVRERVRDFRITFAFYVKKIFIFFNLLNLFWHTDKNFCFYAEVNFWDFVRNDNSNKGTTARLNETRFGPKKSHPQYISAQKISTFWCTGWAWNCQIIFRCASIHGCAGFILSFCYYILQVRINSANVTGK